MPCLCIYYRYNKCITIAKYGTQCNTIYYNINLSSITNTALIILISVQRESRAGQTANPYKNQLFVIFIFNRIILLCIIYLNR